MPRLTARVRLTVPAEDKAEWKTAAAARGMSLSAFLRDVTDDIVAAHQLEVASAEFEFRSTGATLQ